MRSMPRLLTTGAFVLVLTSSIVHAVCPGATWARTPIAASLNMNKLAEVRTAMGNLAGVVVSDGYLVYFWGGP
jgi:hypothetical protein